MSKGGKKKWVLGGLAACIVTVAGVLLYTTQVSSVEENLRLARIELSKGRFAAAGEYAIAVLEAAPNNSTALYISGQALDHRKESQNAVEVLSRIPSSAPDWPESARLLAKICHYDVLQFQKADQLYQQILETSPDDQQIHDARARLLGLCGRRDEAVPHVLFLVRAGVDTDLLMLILKESGGLTDPELLSRAKEAAPLDPMPVLGEVTQLTMEGNHQEALRIMRQSESDSESIHDAWFSVLCGLLRNTHQLEEIATLVPADWQPGSAEEWMAASLLADSRGDHKGALRCAWEAARLKPEALEPLNRTATLLRQLGRDGDAEPFSHRVDQLNQLRDLQQTVIFSGGTADFESAYSLISTFYETGRLWEAWAWGTSALAMPQPDNRLQKLMVSLREEISGLPLQQTAIHLNPAFGIDLSDLPVPVIQPMESHASVGVSNNIQFRRQSADMGFDFTYFKGADVPTRRMFEFTGGGIASLDLDRDGWEDIFCTQGKLWQAQDDRHHDRVFLNRMGQRLEEVSSVAGIAEEQGFGQGVAVGDINSDGFPDVYVANTHTNELWINNGDGTFSNAELPDISDAWTTSCMIADLNGDGDPDVYDVNYVSDDDVFDRLCQGEHGTVMCTPYDFTAARDRILLNAGDGTFSDGTDVFSDTAPIGKGLGVLGFRSGDALQIFVANDTTANLYYQHDADSQSWAESAVAAGLAYSGGGKAEACMGIAFADCDQDGSPEIHVTNFLHESNTIYSTIAPSLFEDRTLTFQLHESTLPVLGFGTQFLDANLDGRQELFVANGHTEDLSAEGTPYQMSPFLFEWAGEGFALHEPGHVGEWSSEKMVGRAVARLDWNRDGKPDLAVGLLDAPTFLLTNESDSGSNSWISVSVTGRESGRDAIGTQIRVSGTGASGAWSQLHQITAGDGYQCSNQRVAFAGCQSPIQHVEIVWPSGHSTEVAKPPQGTQIHIIEGQRAYEVPR